MFKKRQGFYRGVYVKPTDRHQHLHHLSAHPYHTKKPVLFEQTLPISKLCSSEKAFENNKKQMKLWFRKKEYPEDLISPELRNIKLSKLKKMPSSSKIRPLDLKKKKKDSSTPKNVL